LSSLQEVNSKKVAQKQTAKYFIFIFFGAQSYKLYLQYGIP